MRQEGGQEGGQEGEEGGQEGRTTGGRVHCRRCAVAAHIIRRQMNLDLRMLIRLLLPSLTCVLAGA